MAAAATKDVASCDKPRVAAGQALNLGFPNVPAMASIPGELKYLSTRRRRKH